MFLGLALDQPGLALSLSIVFELLWLDILALGAVLPPQGTLSFLLLLPLARMHGWSEPQELLLPIAAAMLCALASARLEQRRRERQDAVSEQVLLWCGDQGAGRSPDSAVFRGVVGRAAEQAVLYVACFCILAAAGPTLSAAGDSILPDFSWAMIYAASMTGAVFGLRIRRAYAVLAGAFLTLGLFSFLLR